MRKKILCTSGAGEGKIKGVNAISGASILDDVPARVETICTWLDARLTELEVHELAD